MKLGKSLSALLLLCCLVGCHKKEEMVPLPALPTTALFKYHLVDSSVTPYRLGQSYPTNHFVLDRNVTVVQLLNDPEHMVYEGDTFERYQENPDEYVQRNVRPARTLGYSDSTLGISSNLGGVGGAIYVFVKGWRIY